MEKIGNLLVQNGIIHPKEIQEEKFKPHHFAGAKKSTLKKHIKSHNRQKSFSNQCNICFMDFTSADAIKIHINTVHEGIKNYKCNICTSSFSTDFCPKTFYGVYHLMRHVMRIHKKSWNYKKSDRENFAKQEN